MENIFFSLLFWWSILAGVVAYPMMVAYLVYHMPNAGVLRMLLCGFFAAGSMGTWLVFCAFELYGFDAGRGAFVISMASMFFCGLVVPELAYKAVKAIERHNLEREVDARRARRAETETVI